MTAKGVSTSESPATAPLTADLEVTLANKLLLARMQTLVSFTIMLARKGLATYRTDKWSLISMCSEM